MGRNYPNVSQKRLSIHRVFCFTFITFTIFSGSVLGHHAESQLQLQKNTIQLSLRIDQRPTTSGGQIQSSTLLCSCHGAPQLSLFLLPRDDQIRKHPQLISQAPHVVIILTASCVLQNLNSNQSFIHHGGQCSFQGTDILLVQGEAKLVSLLLFGVACYIFRVFCHFRSM